MADKSLFVLLGATGSNTNEATASAPTVGQDQSYLINTTNTMPSPFLQKPYVAIDGFDLVWSQQALQAQMQTAMTAVYSIEGNANLSDTEKMFGIQMAMNTWASLANLRTNCLKSVADTLKAIGRNVN